MTAQVFIDGMTDILEIKLEGEPNLGVVVSDGGGLTTCASVVNRIQ
jgi:hypothetical protein